MDKQEYRLYLAMLKARGDLARKHRPAAQHAQGASSTTL